MNITMANLPSVFLFDIETTDSDKLDVFTNQIISFSYSTFDVKPDGQIIQNTNVIFSTNEEELIQQAFTVMEEFYIKHGQIIFAGFGISYFDIPQIRAKIIKYKPIKTPGTLPFFPTKKYD